MATKTKQDTAIAFNKLGMLLQSGVPFLEAVKTVQAECRDKSVAKAFGEINARATQRQDVGNVLAEHGRTFPKSVQLLWQAGNRDPKQLDACCLRIASILKTELRGE